MSLSEALGRPAGFLLSLTAAAGTLVLPMLQFQRFSEDGRLARDCGLATALLFGLLTVIGGACDTRRSLEDGTAAIALTKPVSRGLWLVGRTLGTALAAAWFLLIQGGAAMAAEALSPQYHTTGRFADIRGILLSLAAVAGSLVAAALIHRFRGGRFVRSAHLLLAVPVWGAALLMPHPHWGILTALPALWMMLLQFGLLAAALAVRCTAGLTAGLTLGAWLLTVLFLNGTAFIPFDALAGGGAVSPITLLWLLPQTLAASLFFGWTGTQLLLSREVA